MTPENFDQFCKDICPHCAENSAVRFRSDTAEYVHDTSVEIPGTIGKWQGHTFCLASNFRKKWGGVNG